MYSLVEIFSSSLAERDCQELVISGRSTSTVGVPLCTKSFLSKPFTSFFCSLPVRSTLNTFKSRIAVSVADKMRADNRRKPPKML